MNNFLILVSLASLVPLIMVLPKQWRLIHLAQNGERPFRVVLFLLVLSLAFVSSYPLIYVPTHYDPTVVLVFRTIASTLMFVSAWGFYFLYKRQK